MFMFGVKDIAGMVPRLQIIDLAPQVRFQEGILDCGLSLQLFGPLIHLTVSLGASLRDTCDGEMLKLYS